MNPFYNLSFKVCQIGASFYKEKTKLQVGIGLQPVPRLPKKYSKMAADLAAEVQQKVLSY